MRYELIEFINRTSDRPNLFPLRLSLQISNIAHPCVFSNIPIKNLILTHDFYLYSFILLFFALAEKFFPKTHPPLSLRTEINENR